MKYMFLILSLLAANSYATEIESSNGVFQTSTATGTKTQVCKKVVFLRRNVGTLVTDLKITNLKFYAGTHIAASTSANTTGNPTNPILPSYTLATTTMPGVYNLCITPYDFTWTIADNYEFRFLINLNNTDNGSFILRLQN